MKLKKNLTPKKPSIYKGSRQFAQINKQNDSYPSSPINWASNSCFRNKETLSRMETKKFVP